MGEESIVEHIPKNICRCFSRFLIVPWKQGSLGKKTNRGSGYGLEIPI